jgi:hypothetical protein
MQKKSQVNNHTKDDFLNEVEDLKKKYKQAKEKLAWVEDNFEEGLIEDEMRSYATQIKAIKQQLAQVESSEKKA